ncbi:MAG TPA: hypothetical protein VE078_20365 [Thermoanaerobaculia bacterium]|nr:hypothetical protein [Thermoanaerobaculia bacterium]
MAGGLTGLAGKIARLVLGSESTPGWVCVGLRDAERPVEVRLNGRDISGNHAMVSLVPFLVAIRLDGLGALEARPSLIVWERSTRRELGSVRLRQTEEIESPPYRIGLFETAGHSNRCLPAPRLHAHYLLQRWRLFRDRNPRNLRMAPSELFAKFILFSSPRPVVLVSYQLNGRGNLFPMDLVGETGAPCFLLGLHHTSPAIPAMVEAGRLAISSVPLSWKKTVFGLARNHRDAVTEWSRLPFATVPSSAAAIPVPAQALTVREVKIERTVQVGSHVLFITTTERFERRSEDLQMCHTHGFYQMYLQRQGRPLPEVV